MCVCVCVCLCVCAVYNKTFLADTYVMSHQPLSSQTKTKSESSTAVEFGIETPKSDHDRRGSYLIIIFCFPYNTSLTDDCW